jgi:hypothetical protein
MSSENSFRRLGLAPTIQLLVPRLVGKKALVEEFKMSLKFLLVLCLFFQVGCAYSRISHFRKEVNAQLINDNDYDVEYSQYRHKNIEATCTLEATKKEQVLLEKIQKGNWYKMLYKITYNNITVTKGKWENKELTFLMKDSWPTEKSGIMLGKPLPNFRDNIRMVFEINQTPEKNLIIKFFPKNTKNSN